MSPNIDYFFKFLSSYIQREMCNTISSSYLKGAAKGVGTTLLNIYVI